MSMKGHRRHVLPVLILLCYCLPLAELSPINKRILRSVHQITRSDHGNPVDDTVQARTAGHVRPGDLQHGVVAAIRNPAGSQRELGDNGDVGTSPRQLPVDYDTIHGVGASAFDSLGSDADLSHIQSEIRSVADSDTENSSPLPSDLGVVVDNDGAQRQSLPEEDNLRNIGAHHASSMRVDAGMDDDGTAHQSDGHSGLSQAATDDAGFDQQHSSIHLTDTVPDTGAPINAVPITGGGGARQLDNDDQGSPLDNSEAAADDEATLDDDAVGDVNDGADVSGADDIASRYRFGTNVDNRQHHRIESNLDGDTDTGPDVGSNEQLDGTVVNTGQSTDMVNQDDGNVEVTSDVEIDMRHTGVGDKDHPVVEEVGPSSIGDANNEEMHHDGDPNIVGNIDNTVQVADNGCSGSTCEQHTDGDDNDGEGGGASVGGIDNPVVDIDSGGNGPDGGILDTDNGMAVHSGTGVMGEHTGNSNGTNGEIQTGSEFVVDKGHNDHRLSSQLPSHIEPQRRRHSSPASTPPTPTRATSPTPLPEPEPQTTLKMLIMPTPAGSGHLNPVGGFLFPSVRIFPPVLPVGPIQRQTGYSGSTSTASERQSSSSAIPPRFTGGEGQLVTSVPPPDVHAGEGHLVSTDGEVDGNSPDQETGDKPDNKNGDKDETELLFSSVVTTRNEMATFTTTVQASVSQLMEQITEMPVEHFLQTSNVPNPDHSLQPTIELPIISSGMDTNLLHASFQPYMTVTSSIERSRSILTDTAHTELRQSSFIHSSYPKEVSLSLLHDIRTSTEPEIHSSSSTTECPECSFATHTVSLNSQSREPILSPTEEPSLLNHATTRDTTVSNIETTLKLVTTQSTPTLETTLTNTAPTLETTLIYPTHTLETTITNHTPTLETTLINPAPTLETTLSNHATTVKPTLSNPAATLETTLPDYASTTEHSQTSHSPTVGHSLSKTTIPTDGSTTISDTETSDVVRERSSCYTTHSITPSRTISAVDMSPHIEPSVPTGNANATSSFISNTEMVGTQSLSHKETVIHSAEFVNTASAVTFSVETIAIHTFDTTPATVTPQHDTITGVMSTVDTSPLHTSRSSYVSTVSLSPTLKDVSSYVQTMSPSQRLTTDSTHMYNVSSSPLQTSGMSYVSTVTQLPVHTNGTTYEQTISHATSSSEATPPPTAASSAPDKTEQGSPPTNRPSTEPGRPTIHLPEATNVTSESTLASTPGTTPTSNPTTIPARTTISTTTSTTAPTPSSAPTSTGRGRSEMTGTTKRVVIISTTPGHDAEKTQSPTPPTPPSVFIEVELRMTWRDFCLNVTSFIADLSTIILREKQVIVPHDKFRISNLTEQYCRLTGLVFEGDSRITIQLYIVNMKGNVDIELTIDCSQAIKKGFEGISSIFKNKIVTARLQGLPTIPPDVGPVLGTGTKESKRTVGKMSGVSMVITIAAVGGACCIVLIVLQILIQRRHRAKKLSVCAPTNRASLQSLDHVALGVIPKSRPNSGYWNPALDALDQIPEASDHSHLVNFTGLANFSMETDAIYDEFQRISCDTLDNSVVPVGAEDKNRFANVLPRKETRVRLKKKPDEDNSDYINANYISGYQSKPGSYIATQSPMVNTATDFWRMVWEQQARVILMLNPVSPTGKPKHCTVYWPDTDLSEKIRQFGDFTVTLKKKTAHPDYTECTIEIRDMEHNLKRLVHHFWYTCWPDQGTPEPLSFVKFVLDTRPHYEDSGAPAVIHCGPGTGRSCCLVAVDVCMRMFEARRRVDILQCVSQMRQERAGAVQTREQYAFIYQALNEYAVILSSPSISTRSSVITLHAML